MKKCSSQTGRPARRASGINHREALICKDFKIIRDYLIIINSPTAAELGPAARSRERSYHTMFNLESINLGYSVKMITAYVVLAVALGLAFTSNKYIQRAIFSTALVWMVSDLYISIFVFHEDIWDLALLIFFTLQIAYWNIRCWRKCT